MDNNKEENSITKSKKRKSKKKIKEEKKKNEERNNIEKDVYTCYVIRYKITIFSFWEDSEIAVLFY